MRRLTPADLPLEVLPVRMNVHHFDAGTEVAFPQLVPPLTVLIADNTGVTIVCPASCTVSSDRCSPGWRVLRVVCELDLSLVGVMADLTRILSEVGIPILALSSYPTDYLLVKNESLPTAVEALERAGYSFVSH